MVYFCVAVRGGCIYGGPILRCLSHMGDRQPKHDRDRGAISGRNTIPSRFGCSHTQSWLNFGHRLLNTSECKSAVAPSVTFPRFRSCTPCSCANGRRRSAAVPASQLFRRSFDCPLLLHSEAFDDGEALPHVAGWKACSASAKTRPIGSVLVAVAQGQDDGPARGRSRVVAPVRCARVVAKRGDGNPSCRRPLACC